MEVTITRFYRDVGKNSSLFAPRRSITPNHLKWAFIVAAAHGADGKSKGVLQNKAERGGELLFVKAQEGFFFLFSLMKMLKIQEVKLCVEMQPVALVTSDNKQLCSWGNNTEGIVVPLCFSGLSATSQISVSKSGRSQRSSRLPLWFDSTTVWPPPFEWLQGRFVVLRMVSLSNHVVCKGKWQQLCTGVGLIL